MDHNLEKRNGVNGSVRRCDFELSINWHSTVDGVGGLYCAVNMVRADYGQGSTTQHREIVKLRLSCRVSARPSAVID